MSKLSSTPVIPKVKCDFAILARQLRVRAGLRQRQVAAAMAITPSSYGNLESSQWKTVRRERVDAMSRLYRLDANQHAALVAAWERAPVSEYSQKQRSTWDKRNETRSRSKRLEIVTTVLCDILDSAAMASKYGYPIQTGCQCQAADDFIGVEATTCDLCRAFHALGFPDGWVDADIALDRIAKISPKSPGERGHIPNVPHVPEVKP